MKKLLIYITIVLMFLFLPTNIFASDVENQIFGSIEDEIKDFESNLPSYVLDYFPNDSLSQDLTLTLDNTLNEGKLMEYVTDYIFIGINKTLKTFNGVLILLLISSILELLSSTNEDSALGYTFSTCSSITVILYVFNVIVSVSNNVTNYSVP